MFRTLCLLSAALLFTTGCPESDPAAPCGDAVYWSGRGAAWPTDAVFVGDRSVDQIDALDLLELPATGGADQVAKALVVAELNLAAGAELEDLSAVYTAHAWLADHDPDDHGTDEQADLLVDALDVLQTCG